MSEITSKGRPWALFYYQYYNNIRLGRAPTLKIYAHNLITNEWNPWNWIITKMRVNLLILTYFLCRYKSHIHVSIDVTVGIPFTLPSDNDITLIENTDMLIQKIIIIGSWPFCQIDFLLLFCALSCGPVLITLPISDNGNWLH